MDITHLDLGLHDDLIKDLKESHEIMNYFLIDIDNFSNINVAYGYDIGSLVLYQVAKHLNILKRHNTKLYRYSTDRFVIVDYKKSSKEELSIVCEEILSFFSQTELEVTPELSLIVSLSIGVCVGSGLDSIFKAELAMKESRISKRNNHLIYNDQADYVDKQKKNINWILKIQEAVVNEDIVAYFQPLVNNATQKIEKYECLARIKEDNEIISPYAFMEAARVTGSLTYVTRSLIAQSCKMFENTEYEFSINITQEDLLLGFLEFFLLKNLKKNNIDPSKVVLEMLEQITTLDSELISKQLDSLRELGFQIAIDDFGAENSNMTRLLEIHPEYLKIDGAFVKNIVEDKKSQLIVEAIVDICQKSKIKVIAEYVHNKAVQEKIKSLGIDYSQGYYFGEPKPYLIDPNVNA